MKNFFGNIGKIVSWVIFFSSLLTVQNAFPQSDPAIRTGENSRSIMSGNENRQYLFYMPEGHDGKTPLPLILLFHGLTGSSSVVMELSGLRKVADRKKFLIVAPQGVMKSWNTEFGAGGVNDVEFVKDLIKEVSSKVAIDKRRIYAAGFSQGAKMSSRLACALSNEIAAIGAVAGLDFPGNCAPTQPVSVISFFGTEDRYYSGGDVFASVWAENNGCKKAPKTKKISKDVSQMTYLNCKSNTEVVLFRINGGGHTWPGSPIADRMEKLGMGSTNKDINASDLIWKFFETHPLK